MKKENVNEKEYNATRKQMKTDVLSLKKEYNAQIDRVVSIPKSENDFKNYHYHV